MNLRKGDLVSLDYLSVDETDICERDCPCVEEDAVSTWSLGCIVCHGQHILTNIAEDRAFAHSIQR